MNVNVNFYNNSCNYLNNYNNYNYNNFIITANIFCLSITFDVNFHIILIIGVIIVELDDLVLENSIWEIGFLSSLKLMA